MVLCFQFAFYLSLAQTNLPKSYSLEQCVNLALKNNEGLKTAGLNIEHEHQNKRNATEISKTNVNYTQGQFNSIYKFDENITISQSIPFPTVFSSRLALAKAQEKGSRYYFDVTKAELIYNVKVCYYSLLYFKAQNQLLKQEDSIYHVFLDNLNSKLKQNKSSLLERTSTEMEAFEIHNSLLESEEDIENYYLELYTLMNSPADFQIAGEKFRSGYLTLNADTSILLQHPLLNYYQQQVEVNKQNVKLEKAKIWPDISVSYFNQTIYGPANIFGEDYFLNKTNRLQGFSVGLAIPIWIFPARSRVAAAKINIKQSQSNFEYQNTLLRGQYLKAVNQYQKYKKSLLFYEKNGMVDSKVLISEAIAAYTNEKIDYSEYVQIHGHALNMESNYLELIHQNNLAVLKLEYLLSK